MEFQFQVVCIVGNLVWNLMKPSSFPATHFLYTFLARASIVSLGPYPRLLFGILRWVFASGLDFLDHSYLASPGFLVFLMERGSFCDPLFKRIFCDQILNKSPTKSHLRIRVCCVLHPVS